MSLINEALKKAQKQRTGETTPLAAMPSIGGETAERIARRDKPPGINALLLWVGGGLVAVVVIVAATVIIVKSTGAKDVPANTRTVAAATRAVTNPEPAPAPVPATKTVEAAPAKAAPAPNQALVVPTANPAPANTEPAPVRPEATTVVILPAPAPVAPPPAPAPKVEPAPVRPAGPVKMDARGINFVDSIRVSGIRVSSSDSKVLMNDRVYRIGDTVEHELGIRLVAITSTSLTFEDDRGARYMRNF